MANQKHIVVRVATSSLTYSASISFPGNIVVFFSRARHPFCSGRRDRLRDGPGGGGRPPSRWDALKPDRDRDRGYNNRNNRERDDGDEPGGLRGQDARAGGAR